MTGVLWLDVVVAIFLGYLIWRVSVALIRMLSMAPPEVDPANVVEVDQDYRCSICGAEVTMRSINPDEDKPPRHCREEMVPVWRPE